MRLYTGKIQNPNPGDVLFTSSCPLLRFTAPYNSWVFPPQDKMQRPWLHLLMPRPHLANNQAHWHHVHCLHSSWFLAWHPVLLIHYWWKNSGDHHLKCIEPCISITEILPINRCSQQNSRDQKTKCFFPMNSLLRKSSKPLLHLWRMNLNSYWDLKVVILSWKLTYSLKINSWKSTFLSGWSLFNCSSVTEQQ